MYDFEQILSSTHLVPFKESFRIGIFNSGIDEYNEFLTKAAKQLQELGITNTQLLINNTNGDVVGYFSLCMSSIKLTNEEKEVHHIEEVQFNAIPALKIGKLAIDIKYRQELKGYGSFLIQLIRGIAAEANSNGIACRFITVDADIQYDPNTIEFYSKNDFLFNESFKNKKEPTTISMRLDIYNDSYKQEIESTGTED